MQNLELYRNDLHQSLLMNVNDDVGKSDACETFTRAFSPGFNIAGLRPREDMFDEL